MSFSHFNLISPLYSGFLKNEKMMKGNPLDRQSSKRTENEQSGRQTLVPAASGCSLAVCRLNPRDKKLLLSHEKLLAAKKEDSSVQAA
jgi:hypothetical protein